MCGIFASVATNKFAHTLMDTVLTGLQSLEYRGYDSAGIGWFDTTDFHMTKTLGDVDTLRCALPSPRPHTSLALAHTRWATHGKPSSVNAHPLQGQRFMLVHNGVLDNSTAQRALCLAEGYTFVSQTDSEVLLMLMQRAAKLHTDPPELWLPAMLAACPGQWAIVWVDKHNPQYLYAYSHGRPLLASCTATHAYISSDRMSLVPFAESCAVLADNTLVRASCQGAWAYHDNGWQTLHYTPHHLRATHHDKGDYPHYMLKEIHEQESVLREQYTTYEQSPEYIEPLLQALRDSSDIMIIACGSSFYAACVARYALERYTKKRVSVDIASEFNDRSPTLYPDTCVIVISQSGETADTLTALQHVQRRGLKVVALCNVMSSAIALASDIALPLLAGIEIGVASTKAFCAQVFAVLYLTRRLHAGTVAAADIDVLCALILQQLQEKKRIADLAIRLSTFKHLLYIARDHTVPIAYEGALKYKEITYIHAEAYAGGELKHGPLALIDSAHPTIALITPEHRERMLANIEEIRARNGEVFIFELTDDPHSTASLHWPNVPEWLQPLAFLVPLQLLAYYSCVHLGHNVDRPRNLAKCVTVE